MSRNKNITGEVDSVFQILKDGSTFITNGKARFMKDRIMHYCSTNPGDCGAMLLNEHGQFIGMHVATSGSHNIAVLVPLLINAVDLTMCKDF